MEGQGQGQEERKDRKDSSKRQRTEPEGDEGEAQQQQQPKEGQEQASSTSSTPSSSAAASVSSSSGQAGASNSSVSDYGFRWDRFCEFASGLPDGVKSVTGSTQARGFSDEPVTADLIAAGLRLLKALAPPSSAGNDDDDGEGEQEGEGDGDSKELAPLVVELGQWAVDSAESQKRTREVRIPGGDVGDGRSGVEATVYRASAKAAGKEAGKTEDQKDRFELTHLTGIEGGEYVVVSLTSLSQGYILIASIILFCLY
jgi:hypothetical protein